jgi:hypothetical protein
VIACVVFQQTEYLWPSPFALVISICLTNEGFGAIPQLFRKSTEDPSSARLRPVLLEKRQHSGQRFVYSANLLRVFSKQEQR